MSVNDEKIRAAIAEQAGEWFVANDDGPLDTRDAAALAAWFRASPAHIEEFLGVASVARELRQAQTDPHYSVAAILARARAAPESSVASLWPRVIEKVRARPSGRWFSAAVAMACTLLCVGVFLIWTLGSTGRRAAPEHITALHFETRHGEQLTQRLPDGSVLHLNTDSAVSIRYSKGERLAMLSFGQAAFEVAHEPQRAFTVHAGSAEVVDLGTRFDVRLDQGSTVVTVTEGRVAVRPTTLSQDHARQFVELHADQQLRVTGGAWPATPVTVDAGRATAWLHRQIAFDHEPLERVAAEFNRYTATPIEIEAPALRQLQISGVFATDDTDTFVAFLRSLKGVRVEVNERRIGVMQDRVKSAK